MKVLVVEDDADLRVEIVEYLVRRRHDATGCGTVADARKALAAGSPYDAAICDVGLPDGDGVRFFLDSVAQTPGCRWILMSGSHDVGRLRDALRDRAERPVILEKPMPLRALDDALAGKPAPSEFDPNQ